MYRDLELRLSQHIRDFVRRTYVLELSRIVVQQPPRVELGEYALPLAFELAKKLRKAPRKIAEEIVNSIGSIEGFDKLEVAGAGYINARLTRKELAAALVADRKPDFAVPEGKVLVEHSSINPNKAAHIGHLRNAILGDTFVRLLRFARREVDVQNYIDNTGVQVADVVLVSYTFRTSRWTKSSSSPTSCDSITTAGTSTRGSRSWYQEDKQNLAVRLVHVARNRARREWWLQQSPTRSRLPSFAATSRPWIALTLSTTSCRARAKFSTSISGTLRSKS